MVFISDKILLTDRILTTNHTINSLVAFRKQIETDLEGSFIFENRLLFYYNRLIIPNTWNLYIYLIQEAYNQVSIVYPGR
jgi:hypothetical protein